MDILDREKCPKCGNPAWIAFNDDNSIQFETEEIVCHACAHTEQEDSTRKDSDKDFGVSRFATAFNVMDTLEDADKDNPIGVGRLQHRHYLMEKQKLQEERGLV